MKYLKIVALLMATLLFAAAPAFAAKNETTFNVEQTDFSSAYGDRHLYSLENVTKFDNKNRLIVGYTYGERTYANASQYDAGRWNAGLSLRLSDFLSTYTAVSVASDSPVFAERDYRQDVSLHFGKLVATGGVRRSEYFNDRTVDSWSVRGAYYFGKDGDRGSIGYRYSKFDVENSGTTDAHLVSLRINDAGDSLGNTQLWIGKGSILQDDDFGFATDNGTMTSYTLRRVQPLTANIALNATIGYREYERAIGNYDGTTYGLGLTFGW